MLRFLTCLVLLVSGCAGAQDASVSVCAVASRPDRYNGKDISVRATILPSRHGIGLFDPACPEALIALGSSASDVPRSQNSKFYDAYWQNFSPGGRALSATVQGRFVYIAAQWPVRRLDSFQVTHFVVEPGKRPK